MASTEKAPAGKSREPTFTRNLRYEIASEEGRALVTSYAISFSLGLLWILLVLFGPKTDIAHLLPQADRPIEVTFNDNPPVTELAKIFWVERWGAGQSGVPLFPVVGLCQPLRVQWSVRWS